MLSSKELPSFVLGPASSCGGQSPGYNLAEYYILDNEKWGKIKVRLRRGPGNETQQGRPTQGLHQVGETEVHPIARGSLLSSAQIKAPLEASGWMSLPDHPSIGPMRFSTVDRLIDPATEGPTMGVVSAYYPTRLLDAEVSKPEQKITWVSQMVP